MAQKLSPAMQQYMDIKMQHKDCIVLFRMGDFYETFFADAKLVAKELDITLTQRGTRGKNRSIPLAGVPYHALDSYLPKLLKKGYKVAIVEQVEDPKKAKGLVKRELVRIVTPGTVIDPKLLDAKNNFLMAVSLDQGFGIAFVDVSTGEFFTSETETIQDMENELMKFTPKEVLVPASFEDAACIQRFRDHTFLGFRDDLEYHVPQAERILMDHFKVRSLHGFGISSKPACISASGALLSYLKETQGSSLPNINQIRYYHARSFMYLDDTTIRNLELVSNVLDKSGKTTLLSVLDRTVTPMGHRMLRKNLLQPLLDIAKIDARLVAVNELSERVIERKAIMDHLRDVADIERIITRVNLGNAGPRDLISLRTSLKIIPEIRDLLKDFKAEVFIQLMALDDLPSLTKELDSGISDDPPALVSQGEVIKTGYNARLDELRSIAKNVRAYIKDMEKKERENTGIKSLKIGFNRVFGYYIEVTKPNISRVPLEYSKKQTLVNAERYITQELKEKENLILGAQEKILALEEELFSAILAKASEKTIKIQETASKIAKLDFLCSLAEAASLNNYVKPKMHNGYSIAIHAGRHPVIEQAVSFVPNDTLLKEKNRVMLITGPNMAGKSTYMRQTALIIIMAQMGSFVPADRAEIGIVDRIFTRVGAFDDIAHGQSTFMVEMTQTANILNNATPHSLVILDEIGRGTSTYDGISIAWSVAEFLAKKKAKTLFATHYHVLNQLQKKIKGIMNYNIAVKEQEDAIIFLRKIIEGGTDKSYGIHVAKLAGMPSAVIERAREIQFLLEKEDDVTEKIFIGKRKEIHRNDSIREEVTRYKKMRQLTLDEL